MKKALSLILALGLLLGMMPMQAFASEETGRVTEDTGVTESVDVHEHEYSAAVTAPSCTEQGYTTYTCACGDSYVDDYADAAGHSYENDICAVCGANAPTQDETTGEDEILPEETTSASEDGVPAVVAEEEVESTIGGTCGDNLTWTLDETTGTLTISGTGEMQDYDHDDGVFTPWYSLRESITKLVVEYGVTTIGNYAFATCKNLAEVSIADSVESFGAYAFRGCNSLKAIEIPEGQGRIWAFTFAGCSSLTSITIPDGVSTIEANAFAGSGITSITIPDSITSIGNRAFDGSGLVEVRVGKGVRSLGARAFAFCSSLKSVWFTGNAPETGEANVFFHSGGWVYYPDHLDSWTESARTCICRDASWVPYNVCDKGHSYDANNTCINCGAVKPFDSGKCGDNLYWTYDGNGTITITGTGDMYAYSYVDKNNRSPWVAYEDEITTVVVEEGATSIGYTAFMHCGILKDVSLPTTLVKVDTHGFSFCPALEAIQLPDGLQEIGSYAFSNGGLKSVHLGAAVAVIGDQNPFTDCSAMQQITVAADNPYYCAVDNVLFTKDMETLLCYAGGLTQESYTVPNGVISVGDRGFSGNKQIKNVILPDSLTALESNAFYTSQSLSQINLPCNLHMIGNAVFGFTNIENITIPASVKSIAHYAFAYCHALETIVFEGDAPRIDSGAFGDENYRTEATAYYYASNPTWTEDKLQNYGGIITWVPYCIGEHVYENGLCVNCGDQYLIITRQPEDTEAELGKKFSIPVEARGEGLTYQWYVKEAGAKAFKVSVNKTSSYAYAMQSYMHNRQVYCVITDQYGNQVTTETATITRPPQELKITQQPQDARVNVGEKFSIKPVVEGDGLTYQWYVKESGAKAFKVSSNKTSAYAYTMQKYMIGRQVYCVITDKDGNSVTTDVATISLPPVELKILEQPVDVYAVKGEKFSISFVVQGDGLTYQWYYKESYMKDFKASSNKTSAYAYSMQTYMNERSVYCVITDKYGNQVQTEAVTIHLEK